MRYILIACFLFCSNSFGQTKSEIESMLDSEAFTAQFSKEDIAKAREALNKMNSKDFENIVNKAKSEYEKNPEKFQNAVDYSKIKK